MSTNDTARAVPQDDPLSAAVLREQHGDVRKLATDLLTITLGAAPSDSEDFGRLRVAISRALRDHFNAEDQALGAAMWSPAGMPPLLGDWDAQRQKFRQSYSQHLRDWPLAEALREWGAYRRAVADCIKAGEALVLFEETHVYPLIPSRQG